MNASCHMHECVMSHEQTSHVTRINTPCHEYQGSCHKYGWVMSLHTLSSLAHSSHAQVATVHGALLRVTGSRDRYRTYGYMRQDVCIRVTKIYVARHFRQTHTRHTHKCTSAMSRISMGPAKKYESCCNTHFHHTYECVVSHVITGPVTSMDGPCHYTHSRHVTRMNASCHMYL